MVRNLNKKFYHVACLFPSVPDPSTIVGLEERFDGIRYMSSCWILFTDVTIEEMHAYFKIVVGNQGRFLIAELNVGNRSGVLPNEIWDWIETRANSMKVFY